MSWGMMAEQMGWGGLEEGWRKGPWTAEEDKLLIQYVNIHGEGRWNSVARLAGLRRNGKSCRLRWVNYLRPDLKRGQITPNEERIIMELHARWGNRWSTIARSLPGRTDNEIKNYWRTHFKKKAKSSSENSEKARARLLRRQQFQQQQQQLLLHQQNQMDMKKIMSLSDENEKKVSIAPQVRSEMFSFYQDSGHHDHDQEQGFLYSLLNGYASVPETSNEEIIMWEGLWNLDDLQANMNATAAVNKTGLMHTFAATSLY